MSARDIFSEVDSRWVEYEAELHIDVLVGGIPKDPDTVRGWLKARMEVGDAEINAVANETIEQMGWSVEDATANLDRLVDAVMEKTAPKGNSFKMVDGQLVYEGRCLKAALNEAANACYPGVTPWPGRPEKIRKGLESYMKERVEVLDRYLPLGRSVPDIQGEQRIKHVSGPQGRRSAINVVDIVTDAKITARIAVLDDCISREVWSSLWGYVEKGGVGADRGRGDGRSELLGWRRLDG